MAKQLIFEEDSWLDCLMSFTADENLSAEIMALEPNENTLGEKSLVPNIATNEERIKGLDVGLSGGHDSGPNEVDDGSVRARKKGKFVVTENHGTGQSNHRTCNQVSDRALQERERRKLMAALFKDLHVLLPQVPPKVPKATVVEEAMSTIKSLEETCDSLEKRKQERLSTDIRMAPPVPSETRVIENDASMMKTWCTPNIFLHVFGANARVNICSVKNDSFFTSICYILRKHNVDVQSVRIYSDHAKTMYSMNVRVNVPIEVVDIFSHEDLFKLAAAEINYVYSQILEAPRLEKIM